MDKSLAAPAPCQCLPIVVRLLLLAETIIGLLAKSNAFGYKDSDKKKIPSIHFNLCNWPLFAYTLVLVLTQETECCVCKTLDMLLVLPSLLVWGAWFYKHKMYPYLILFSCGVIGISILLMKCSGQMWIPYLSIATNFIVDIHLFLSMKHYIEEAKARERRVPKNCSVLFLQTVIQCLLFYGVVKKDCILGMVVIGAGAVLCHVMWALDYIVKIVERPPEPETEIERELLKQHMGMSQGIPELNEGIMPNEAESTDKKTD